MLAHNPLRMDYYRRYQEIIAEYNREKDRATVEATFAALMDFVASLDQEQQRAAEDGLSETELMTGYRDAQFEKARSFFRGRPESGPTSGITATC